MKNKDLPADVFRKNLADLMDYTKMKKSEVGKASGTDPRMIDFILKGERKPTIDKAEAIARAFGLTGWEMLRPNILKCLSKSKQMNLLLDSFVSASDEGRDYILRVAEKESEYKVK